jgi:hypothetical protein
MAGMAGILAQWNQIVWSRETFPHSMYELSLVSVRFNDSPWMVGSLPR